MVKTKSVVDNIDVTISGVKGSQSYSFSYNLRKIIIVIASIILFLVVLGVVWIFFLNSELKELDVQRKKVQEDYKVALNDLEETQKQWSKLKTVINQERLRIEEFGNNLERIEDLIGVKNENTEEEQTLESRFFIVEQSSQEKSSMLYGIPSGYPMPSNKIITSKFGWRTHPVVGGKHNHKGVDMRSKIGTKVVATADGVVEYSGRHKSGFGKLVIINHRYGFRTLFAHLDELKVKSKQVIRKGQLIALSGNTGLSTGPHLHYEITFNRRNLDPKPFMQWSLEKYEPIFKKITYVPWQSLIKLVNLRQQAKVKVSSVVVRP